MQDPTPGARGDMLFSARLDTALAILTTCLLISGRPRCAQARPTASKWGTIWRPPDETSSSSLPACSPSWSSPARRHGFVWTLRPERVRDHLITAVSNRFASRVDVDTAMVSIYPRPAITGSRLRIQMRNADPAMPPLVSVGAFQASAPFSGLIGPRVQLGNVSLVGTDDPHSPGGLKPTVASLDNGIQKESRREDRASIVIDEIVSHDARLEIATRKANKLPRASSRFTTSSCAASACPRARASRRRHQCHPARPRRDDRRLRPVAPRRAVTDPDSRRVLVQERQPRRHQRHRRRSVVGRSVSRHARTHRSRWPDRNTDFSIDIANQPVPLFTRFKAHWTVPTATPGSIA